jgi:hypothetical protein
MTIIGVRFLSRSVYKQNSSTNTWANRSRRHLIGYLQASIHESLHWAAERHVELTYASLLTWLLLISQYGRGEVISLVSQILPTRP